MSAAALRLFRKLVMLSTQSFNEVSDNFLRGIGPKEIVEVETKAQLTKTNSIMKNSWCYFWSLDATIKINMLIL